MTEKRINDKLVKLQKDMEKKIPTYTKQVTKAFDLARARVSDIIVKYVKDGTVPKNRINALIRELSAVEASLYRDLLSLTTIVIEGVARDAGEGINGALVVAIGATTLLALREEEDGAKAISAAGYMLALGTTLLLLIKKVLETVFGRRGDDGLNLRNRLRKLAADVIADVQKSLRKSNKTGEDYADIQRNVAQIFGDVEWRVSRIVDTEASVAYRTAVSKAAQESGLVKAVKIIDFPHGAPGEHEKHKCHILANRDAHGMGKGVYPVSNLEVRNPHPQCRSRLVLVMKEGVLDAK